MLMPSATTSPFRWDSGSTYAYGPADKRLSQALITPNSPNVSSDPSCSKIALVSSHTACVFHLTLRFTPFSTVLFFVLTTVPHPFPPTPGLWELSLNNQYGVHYASSIQRWMTQPTLRHRWFSHSGLGNPQRTPHGSHGPPFASPTTLRTRWTLVEEVLLVTQLLATQPKHGPDQFGSSQHPFT